LRAVPLSTPTPTPTITPTATATQVSSQYAIIESNDTVNPGTVNWSPAELSAIDTAVNNVGLALQRISTNPISPQAVFNRVLAEGGVTPYVWFVRANSTTSSVGGSAPDVTVSYIANGQTRTVTYEDINPPNTIGNCKAFESALWGTNNIPRPRAVVCNGTFTASEYTIVHELGHLFDYRSGNALTNFFSAGNFSLGSCPSPEFGGQNYIIMGAFGTEFRRGNRGWGSGTYLSNFQQSPENIPLEAAADMFLNWVYRSNSPTGATIISNAQTNAQAPSNCPTNQSIPPSESWNGFKNQNWDANGAYDWGVPGDVRYVLMQSRMTAIFANNSGW
jgi:hypothetical protein